MIRFDWRAGALTLCRSTSARTSDDSERMSLDSCRKFSRACLPSVGISVILATIPKINDARGVWRLGMRKIEECFAEHIANMHLDFEDKAIQYEKIESQLQTNHQFLMDWYVKMQNHLNDKYASIKIEKDAWE